MSEVMERFGLPSGRYSAVVNGIELGKAPRAKAHDLSVRAVVERNGKPVVESHVMGNGDPYELSPSQRKSLRAMAKRLRVQDKGPAEEIIDAIRSLEGQRVTAHVRPTKFGDLAVTFSRNGSERHDSAVTGDVLDALPETEPDYRQRTVEAQGAHQQLLSGLHHAHRGLALAAQASWKLRQDEGWVALGYDSVGSYLASPELSLSRSQFYALADIWQQYVEQGGQDHQRLCAPSKLEVPLAALKAGEVTAEEALSDAETLGLRDLRAKYRGDEDADVRAPGQAKISFPFACRACGVIAESADQVDADGIVYMHHRWPAGWSHEQVVAAYDAARAAA